MFSNALDGILYQHYELEEPTWTSGGPVPNIEGVGVEHEGVKPNKFTDAQADTDARLYLSLKEVCPNIGLPIKGQGIRIHREVAPGTTTCPNDRDRYDKYDAIGEEEIMPYVFIASTSHPNDLYVLVEGCMKKYLPFAAFKVIDAEKLKYVKRIISDVDFAAIPDA